MRIFVTGATGFVGREIVQQLLAAGHTPRCLVRPGSEGKLAMYSGIEIQPGDALDPTTLDGALADCDAVIHLIGIIREFPGRGITFRHLHVEATENIITAATIQGVRRYLQMSANGAQSAATIPYQRSKWQAEELVREAELDWTIFRPSLIYGPGDGFVSLLAQMVRRLPLVPVFGGGNYLLSPVTVGDVAASFVKALDLPETIGQTYHCCGPQALSYNALLDAVAAALGKNGVTRLHQPLLLMQPLVALGEHFDAFPITSGQLKMLLAGNSCDPQPWAKTFGLTPTPFAAGLASCLKR